MDTTVKTVSQITKEISILETIHSKFEHLSFNELTQLRKDLSIFIKSHSEYIAPIKESHIVAKNQDSNKIMNRILGKNQSYKVTVKMIKDGEINPISWVKDGEKFNQLHVDFICKSLKNVFYFVKSETELSNCTPNKILDIIKRVSIMKPENFTKAIQAK